MNKRFWMALVACYFVSQGIGFLIHGLWLDATYQSLAAIFRPKESMDALMWQMLVASAIAVFAFCYIFTKGYEGKGVMEGVRYGVLIALLLAIPGSMMAHWVYPVPASLAIKWAIADSVHWVVLGAVAALIYKPDAPAAA